MEGERGGGRDDKRRHGPDSNGQIGIPFTTEERDEELDTVDERVGINMGNRVIFMSGTNIFTRTKTHTFEWWSIMNNGVNRAEDILSDTRDEQKMYMTYKTMRMKKTCNMTRV